MAFSRLGVFMALVKKEALATLKEKLCRAVLIGPFIVYCFLFGYVANFNLENVPYALCDMAHTSASAQLIRAVDASPAFERVKTLASPTEIRSTIDRAEALLVLYIASDFSKKIENKHTTSVQVIVDGRNSSTAQLAAGYISQITQKIEEKNSTTSFLTSRLLFNPNNITQWSTMPGIIVVLSMLQVMLLSSLSVVREREQGTFEQLLVTPYSTKELLAAKACIPIMIGVFQSTLIFLIDMFWFRIPFSGSVISLYVTLILFTFSIVGIGLTISSASKTMQQGLLYCFFIMMPMVLLSGLFSPIENMPDLMQIITYINPLRFSLLAIRRIYLAGANLIDVAYALVPLVCITCVLLPVAYHYFKKRL